jgi:hypothetical protein
MPSDCLFILLNLICFSDAVSYHKEGPGSWYKWTVEAAEFNLVHAVTDDIVVPDFARMDETCVQDICVRYHRRCTVSRSGETCDYIFGPNPSSSLGEGTHMSVTMTRGGPFKHAERTIRINVSSATAPVFIPLSALAIKSKADVPRCRRRYSDTCYP